MKPVHCTLTVLSMANAIVAAVPAAARRRARAIRATVVEMPETL